LDVIPLGQLPEPGTMPRRMHAWVIRAERHGPPLKSFQRELMPLPAVGPHEVLILNMAAGVNYNGIWAGLGQPVSPLKVHGRDYHIAGSDSAGIVWKVGERVEGWRPGDEIVVHCNQACEVHCGRCDYDPMGCQKQAIWGYETPDGSFAQFSVVQAQQVLRKPAHLSWEEASSYGLVYFTAYRMLVDRAAMKPGDVVLVWGAGGGLGSFAVQLVHQLGGRAVGVVSSAGKAELVRSLGAAGVVNRNDFPDLLYTPGEDELRKARRLADMKRFGRAIWDALGERRSPDIVFEHVGQSTFPASVWLCARLGRIVICGATTGYDLHFDVRHLWMHQKSIIGSHFCNGLQARQANELVIQKKIRPVLTRTYDFDQVPLAHDDMMNNRHMGTIACLVHAPRTGLRDADETRVAGAIDDAAAAA
jgi:crotonyl-CoA carboxylase/reductase